MAMHRAILSLVLLLGVPASSMCAQRLANPVFSNLAAAAPGSAPAAPGIPAGKQTSPGVMALGGILGGAAGALAGGIIGAKAADTCEDCALEGLLYGFVAGGSTALPLGVHLANHRRGNYGLSLLASLAIGAVGFGTTLATHGDGRILIAVPVLQLVSSIAVERATSR
jgi:hypothetical protein